ncbi:MAG: SRPBCC family protein [Desulfonatronovibrionaceae bacterium]
MKLHRLQYEQILPLDPEQAWSFFSSPENLCRITPSWLCFDIIHQDSACMYAGMIFQYRIKAVAGLPMTWVTEITRADPPFFFVDEQRMGPYLFWHHQHHFQPVNKQTRMTDTVHYALPYDPFSRPLHAFLVKPRLKQIFAFRQAALKEIFPA